MSAELLTAFARGGGSPPATSETLRVYVDGTARAVVGNAWPLGAPQNEAGSYEQRLAPDELTALAQLAGAVAAPPSPVPGPADAGRCELALPGGRRAAWPMHAPPPGDLGPLVDRLRELLAATRRHPLGALALAVEELELRLRNPGTEPVGLVPDRLQVRATAAGNGAPRAVAIDPAALPAELAPGADTTLADAPAGVGVVVRLDAVVPYEGAPLRLECVLRT
jgi:hypothetical protein